jgi:HEAT repeat protein
MTFIAVMQVALFLHLPQEAAPKGPEDNKTLLARLVKGDQKAIAPLVKQGEAMVPTLAEMLPVTPAPDNVYVVIALAEIAESVGPRAKLAAPALCEALRSEDRAVSATAARALGAIGANALPGVLEGAKKPGEKLYTIRAIRHMGSGAKAAAPTVMQTLKATDDTKLRTACIEALGALGPSGKETAAELLAYTRANKQSSLTTYLIVAIGNLGADSRPAVPYLTDMLDKSSEVHLRMQALEAISKIGAESQETNDKIAKLLSLPDMPKLVLLDALARGPLGKEALKMVEETMRDKDAAVRLRGAVAYGRFDADHPAVVSILIESLKEPDPKMRKAAAETIGSIRPSDDAVVDALRARRDDPDATVRQAVADALRRFKKKQ